MIVLACFSPMWPLEMSVRSSWRAITGSGNLAAATRVAFSSAGCATDHLRAVS